MKFSGTHRKCIAESSAKKFYFVDNRWKLRKTAKFVINKQGVSTGCHVRFAMAGFTRAVLK